MLDREAGEALFLEHLPLIDRIAAKACSKYGLQGTDADDFTSGVRMKLIEDDYVVIRRFVGTSSFKTYLTGVIGRHLADFVRDQRGRWRVSAAAERLGSPAVELERLVRRDRYTLRQAGEKLRTSGLTTLSDVDLARLLGQIPERAPLRPIEGEPSTGLDFARGDSRADERVLNTEAESRRARIGAALAAAIAQLDEEDQMIVQMHFIDDKTVANVARALRLEQKPLYRHVDRLRARLVRMLESAGLHRDEVRGLLHEHDEP
jgi:RNA polymerase sigma factor (sigma-70 family)